MLAATRTTEAIADRSEKFWDKAAQKYAASRVGDPQGYEKTLKRTGELLPPDADVLELGCGTGTTALRLAPLAARYIATDISPAMIEIAASKLAAEPRPSLTFKAAVAETLPAPRGGFDAVLAFNLLHLVASLPATLASIRNLLKPDGLLIAKTPCLGDMNPLIRYVMLPAMRLAGKAPHVNCFTAAGLERALHDAGFVIEATEWHATRGKDARPFTVARIAA